MIYPTIKDIRVYIVHDIFYNQGYKVLDISYNQGFIVNDISYNQGYKSSWYILQSSLEM